MCKHDAEIKTTICERTHLGKRAHVPIRDLGFSNTFSLEECNGECKGKKHHQKINTSSTQVFFAFPFVSAFVVEFILLYYCANSEGGVPAQLFGESQEARGQVSKTSLVS